MAARLRSSTGALQQRLDAGGRHALPGAAQVRQVQARIAAASGCWWTPIGWPSRAAGWCRPRAARVRGLRGLVASLNADLGPDSSLDDVGRRSLGRWVQGELLPFLHASRLGERMYAKPRGYAGDFLTIAQIYEDVGVGTGRLGPLIDRCLLDLPAAQAVRNRRGLLLEEIEAQLAARPAGVTRVTSLASGPAAELFDAFAALDDPTRLQATCIDIDDEALTYVAVERSARGLDAQMRLEQGNLVYLATGRTTLDLPPQDLIYSIGLIDYFSDAFVVKLLNAIHGLLAPGGQVILGNFHPRNPTRALMDHVLDWKLIHRDEADMDRLFAASAFGGPCARVRDAGEGVNLYAFGRKAWAPPAPARRAELGPPPPWRPHGPHPAAARDGALHPHRWAPPRRHHPGHATATCPAAPRSPATWGPPTPARSTLGESARGAGPEPLRGPAAGGVHRAESAQVRHTKAAAGDVVATAARGGAGGRPCRL